MIISDRNSPFTRSSADPSPSDGQVRRSRVLGHRPLEPERRGQSVLDTGPQIQGAED